MKNRNISLDLLKIILAIFVVFLHCRFLSEYSQKFSYLTVEGLFRIAVPIFFIINGYFYNKIISKNSIKKWAIRVTILYSVWMIIYSPLWFQLNFKLFLIRFFIISYFHLWYLKAMLFCGILLFIIKHLDSKKMLFLALILFFMGTTIQYLGNYHVFESNLLDKLTNTIFTYRNFLFLGFPFFILGNLIHKNEWHLKLTLKQNIVFVTAGIMVLFIESSINFYYAKEATDNLISLLFLCPMIFIFVKKMNLNYGFNSKNIALFSTAIYLSHPWAMKLLPEMGPTLLSLATTFVSLIVSSILILLNKKVKILL